ncbi:MAG: radical SAM protein [Candidatus Omnitrophota bacterium]
MILINPKSTKFGIFERYVPLSVPIGLGYLAGSLLSKGHKVSVLDEHINPISEELIRKSAALFSPPYLFGISTLTACAKRSYEIVGIIKGLYPESKIVMGGIHPTVMPDEVLGNRDIDYVLRREAENTLLEFCEAIKENRDVTRICGLSYRTNGRIIHNPNAELPDLSVLAPFPYHLFNNKPNRYNFGFIASSRGCPYDCIFCSQRNISGQRYRYFPAEAVLRDIDLLVNKYHQIHINFVDDNFTANQQRVIQLCEGIINSKLHEKVTFDCQTRADAVNGQILSLLRKAGFRLINFGFETSSERLMVLLNKKETVRQNIEAVKLVKKHGLGVSGTFIFGLPTETRADRLSAYRMARQMDLDYVRFNNATPYPGTQLYEMAKKEGRIFAEKDWSNLNACGSLVSDSLTETRLPYVPVDCDEKILKRDIVRANLFFSLRPKKVFRLLVKRVGPAGWFYLPERWYLSLQEWSSLTRLSMSLLKSFFRNLF